MASQPGQKATLPQLIAEHSITATARKLGTRVHQPWRPNQPATVYRVWRITLHRGDRHQLVTTTETAETSSKAEPPTAALVMAHLILDALDVQHVRSFDEWAEQYDYPDTPRARALYAESLRAARDLRRFLGEHFPAFMACTNSDQQ